MPLPPDMSSAMGGTWEIEMMNAPCHNPLGFLCGFFCPCCYAHKQREELLDLTQEPYVCCGGICGCGPCAEPCESRQPWLCLEVTCCSHNAILGNRFMLQTRFDIGNDPCDDKLLQVIACINCLACIVEMFGSAESAEHARDCAECINAAVCSCFLVQQDTQIRRIKEILHETAFRGMPAHVLQVLPPKQQQMYNNLPQPSAPPLPEQPPMQPPTQAAMAAPLMTQQAAPATQLAPQYATRQMMVVVPPGVAPGRVIQFQTPEGTMQQTTVPFGCAPGQQFLATY